MEIVIKTIRIIDYENNAVYVRLMFLSINHHINAK